MNPVAILKQSASDGVILSLSATGTIKATGNQEDIEKWLPVIRENKSSIVAALSAAENNPPAPLSDDDEEAILAWLNHIGETDPPTIGEVIDRCRSDLEARSYFVGRATKELPKIIDCDSRSDATRAG